MTKTLKRRETEYKKQIKTRPLIVPKVEPKKSIWDRVKELFRLP